MPMRSAVFGPIFAQVTMNASGTGFIAIQANGQNLVINNMSVRCSTAVLEATVTVYKGQIGEAYRLSGTFTGSSGDSNADPIPMVDGDRIFVVFTGADVGCVGTVTITGTADVGSGGFRAVG